MRTIDMRHPARVTPVAVDAEHDIMDWLQEQAAALGPAWLLAHADDGVIWGRWTPTGGLVTSSEAAQGHPEAAGCPPLRWLTLQQARLFSGGGEVLLWRDGYGVPHARLTSDAAAGELLWRESFDEPQRLRGTHGTPLAHGFTLLADGQQGLRHVVPFPLPPSIPPDSPPRLCVRHYLADEPLARVTASRLLGIEWKGAALVPA